MSESEFFRVLRCPSCDGKGFLYCDGAQKACMACGGQRAVMIDTRKLLLLQAWAP